VLDRFPHLRDTNFPNLNNIDTYTYQNNFDYKRWTPNTKLKLCNVRWNSDYNDCVKFESDSERDAWFDSLTENDNTVQYLNTNVLITQGTAKVPMPFDVASNYNYLVVEVPVITSENQMVDYEVLDGTRRWHFFITDWAESAGNCTILTLQLDIWTQYINNVGFNYMMLERGHAPVAATDTDKYLENPMKNCDYLLTPDVDFGGEKVCDGSQFIPFGNGKKYLCFVSTCMPEQLGQLGSVSAVSSSFTDPTFYDVYGYPDETGRWGYQYGVSGFDFGNGYDYSNVKTPAGNNIGTAGADRVPTGVTIYAIQTSNAYSFLQACVKKTPSFLKTIIGSFMVAEEMLTLGMSFEIADFTVYLCHGNSDAVVADIKLDKKMFNYPSKYERFAKLYTYPYSELEITDNYNKSVTVRIESCGDNIKANAITAIAYPYLNLRMFITGIGGTGSNTYEWVGINNSYKEKMQNDNWCKLCFDMNIPVYALYMDGNTAWNLANYNREMRYTREAAITTYHNTVRESNNSAENGYDLASTARLNAIDSANAQKTITDNSADAQKTMTDNAANTNNTNTHNLADTTDANNSNSRDCASYITEHNNAALQNNQDTNVKVVNLSNAVKNLASAVSVSTAKALTGLTAIENMTQTVAIAQNTMAQNATQAVTSAVSGSIQVGFGVGSGNPVSAVNGVSSIVGAAGQIASAAGSLYNGNAIINATEHISKATNSLSDTQYELHKKINDDSTDETNTYNQEVVTHNIECANANTTSSNYCNEQNTNNTTSTMRTNADNTANMQKTNATTLQTTQKTNASILQAMQINNANRTQKTSYDNGVYTNHAQVESAQGVIRNAQSLAKCNNADSYNESPVQLCNASTDLALDYYRTRGIQVKVKKQNMNAIARTADTFARYGYAYDGFWDIDSLCLMKHFTYWKTSECWVYDEGNGNDSAQRGISNIFNKGVTVWSNPDEIGKVSIYDN
jgi:hypothetical protein